MILALFQLKYIQITACGDIDETLLNMESIKMNGLHSYGHFNLMTEETQVIFLIHVTQDKLWTQDTAIFFILSDCLDSFLRKMYNGSCFCKSGEEPVFYYDMLYFSVKGKVFHALLF